MTGSTSHGLRIDEKQLKHIISPDEVLILQARLDIARAMFDSK
jgi:hypothetical protein